MLIVMKSNAGEAEFQAVEGRVRALGFEPHRIRGAERTAIAVTGNSEPIDPAAFSGLAGVRETIRVTRPWKLAARESHPADTVVMVGGRPIGGPENVIIAGPCAVEGESRTLAIAEAVARSGARFFRGGAWKPRTSPYSFQGLGREGLRILSKVRQETGLPIITEAVDEESLAAVEDHADAIQIGARNMQNFALLKRAGRSRLPVFLKRGPAATIEEFILAAEYLLAAGNAQVFLCERGVRTFGNHSRSTLDLAIVPSLRRMSHLPILVDPSHGTGRREQVGPMALAALAAGAHGVMIEVHDAPEKALCDGAQALLPSEFDRLAKMLKGITRPAPRDGD
ncbi:MAG TPA: 3-deoxy-7-phosphoheptulonate synthase [Candidatus Polarisedimenticolia bacterium]|nr:3-deoxy-7-phosphoheptulonate synthase [Candidatus Polarisedimenticolia bacterium]